jgi:hypothetical protein
MRDKNRWHLVQNLYQHRTAPGAACVGAFNAIINIFFPKQMTAPFTVGVPGFIHVFVGHPASAQVAVTIVVLVDYFVCIAKIAPIVTVYIGTVVGNDTGANLTPAFSGFVKAAVGQRFPTDITFVIHILIRTAVCLVLIA